MLVKMVITAIRPFHHCPVVTQYMANSRLREGQCLAARCFSCNEYPLTLSSLLYHMPDDDAIVFFPCS